MASFVLDENRFAELTTHRCFDFVERRERDDPGMKTVGGPLLLGIAKALSSAILLCLFLLLVLRAEGAVEWYVDTSVAASGDGATWETAFKTIQAGIDAASDGDRVTVAPGTYVENLLLSGKNIVVTGTNPADPSVVSVTIIDGNAASPVVTFAGTETEACVLCGFTIQNGRAEYGGGVCGGTQEQQTTAAIRNNVITRNRADGT
jgi:pectin methylesterase-like acyl-CoA thioesterase